MMARQSVGAPGEPPGVVLSATTSVRLPGTPPQRVFDYLRDEQRRGEWDILANGEAMQEMDHIAKGQHHGNAVSLLRPNATSGNQNNMLILQETCTDASGSLVVYAPVDVQSMHVVMGGGDSAYVSLLPSGFARRPPLMAAAATTAPARSSPWRSRYWSITCRRRSSPWSRSTPSATCSPAPSRRSSPPCRPASSRPSSMVSGHLTWIPANTPIQHRPDAISNV
uniref:HD-Zip IV C-terminal domain-containing protein n=1 Tax=Triticum urartu TaxID=4572 RepID=A0A8R7RBS8_TRIUA